MKEHDYGVEINYLDKRITKLENSLSKIMESHQSLTHKFIVIETKRSLLQYVVQNWWKLAAFITPALFMLGEISVQVRHLIH